MDALERSKSRIRNLLPTSLSGGQFAVSSSAAVVQLIDSPRRVPATAIEERLAAALKEVDSISVAGLVKTVAGELYCDELRRGAGVLDIGLFGDRLFNRDIIQELNAGNGVLWEIKQQRKS